MQTRNFFCCSPSSAAAAVARLPLQPSTAFIGSRCRCLRSQPVAARPVQQAARQHCVAAAVTPRHQQHRHGHRRSQQPAWICRSSLASPTTPEPIPDDVELQVNPDSSAKEVLYDEASKTVRIPLAALTDGQRRTKMVMFTCNKCGGRSARLVNPTAWARGAVFCQCQHCQAWHMLRADKSIVEEIRYNDPDWKLPEAQQGTAAAAADAAALAASGGVAEMVPEDSQQSSGTGLSLAAGGPAERDDRGEEEATSKPQQ